MFVTTLLIMTQNQKQLKCYLTGEQMNKLWCIHISKYWLAKHKHSIVTHHNMDTSHTLHGQRERLYEIPDKPMLTRSQSVVVSGWKE